MNRVPGWYTDSEFTKLEYWDAGGLTGRVAELPPGTPTGHDIAAALHALPPRAKRRVQANAWNYLKLALKARPDFGQPRPGDVRLSDVGAIERAATTGICHNAYDEWALRFAYETLNRAGYVDSILGT